jgi:Tfp pilus assembly protein PilN
MAKINTYVDDDIDDINDINDINDNDDTVNSKTMKVNGETMKVNGETNQDLDMEKLLSSLGGLDEATLNKLAEMKDMTDINNLDFKKLRQMFSKMNIDKNKLKSLKQKMEQVENQTTKDSTPLTRDELRKKLREKTQLMRKTRIMK